MVYLQLKRKRNMSSVVSNAISLRSAKFSMLLFFSLLLFSVAFFVFAQSSESEKNIFQDSDQDGLSNDEEKLYGTDAYNKATDGDSYSDGVEVESGYNPLKKAPGDRNTTLAGSQPETNSSSPNVAGGENLTNQVSREIASVLQGASATDGNVTLDQINESTQKILGGETVEVTLPEVDVAEIKIKKGPSKSLSEKKRKEQERQDILEYLTVMSYILANNSPKSFQTEDELGSMLGSLTDQSLLSITTGNTQYLDQISEQGDKILRDTKDIEVPEKMLDVHIKALKMAKYAKELKGELKPNQSDPLGQIAVLSKIQGFLGVVQSFSSEIHQKLGEYEITE